MPFATDIPHFFCKLRAEYVHDMRSHHGELIDCQVFGVDSVESFAIGFDCLTDCGAMFARLPISAFCWKPCEHQDVGVLQAWDNFSYSVEAHEYAALRMMACTALLRDRQWYRGQYMFTLSWLRSPYAEGAGEGGFKRAHIIKLDNGNFAAQPNNRIKWHEPSFITKPFPDKPTFLTNSYVWKAEEGHKWRTEDEDVYFYKGVSVQEDGA